ncbi:MULTISPECIES: response regulator [Nostocales]|uniref:Response regulator n=3 Tax=Nostocales TaxID=1161 RepID=A0A0C1NAV2_9CYAN|nr:response regulator [Tolypothrix bouteillei]KAF3884660.1 response regulator [Tolypothrix bouteillei VB521301]
MTGITLQKKTVLVVEDELSDQFLLQRAFGQINQEEFALHVVKTAEDAILYLQGSEPYQERAVYPLPVLIVLDLRLPGMSGLELLKWIKKQPHFNHLPIIALTAFGNRDLPRAYDLGIDFYLLKPVETNTLAEILSGLGIYSHGAEKPENS